MENKDIESILPDWAMGTNCAITVCDSECRIIFMNERSREVFAGRGGATLIGHNLFDYHNERSAAIIRHMLSTGESNSYTIEKQGVHKIIYQTPWRDAAGNIAGLVEISMPVPPELPHYVR